MDPGVDRESHENMVVLAADGDDREKREMAEILRILATAMDDESYLGNPLLVLEQRCYERLKKLHRKCRTATKSGN